jgi:hypothetical protein
LTLVLVIAVANQVALGLLIHSVVIVSGGDQGRELLLAAGQVWFTNIIVFGLAFWELDCGGPVIRQSERCELPAGDFRFSQNENDDGVAEVSVGSSDRSDWVPTLMDYLYVSVTNSTAFSPTDTMPLPSRAKLLMAAECISALLTSVLVMARCLSAVWNRGQLSNQLRSHSNSPTQPRSRRSRSAASAWTRGRPAGCSRSPRTERRGDAHPGPAALSPAQVWPSAQHRCLGGPAALDLRWRVPAPSCRSSRQP